MKKVSFLVLFLLIVIGTSFYFFNENKEKNKYNKLIYNNATNKWEKFNQEDPLALEREEILDSLENSDGLQNQSIIRGYFENYDESTQKLKIKYLIPFSQGNLFENIELKLIPSQTIYCAPSVYIDPNTNKSYQTKNLVFPVKNGKTLWIPTEKYLDFEKFIENSDDLTFLYIQLTNNFSKEELNYIQKIIAIGLCE